MRQMISCHIPQTVTHYLSILKLFFYATILSLKQSVRFLIY